MARSISSTGHNPLIGHLQHHLRDPNRDHVHGRIYRITYEGRPLLTPPKIDGAADRGAARAAEGAGKRHARRSRRSSLASTTARRSSPRRSSGWRRSTSNDPDYEHHLLEALWVHQWHNVVDVDLLQAMLRSPEPRARAAATRVLCYWRDRVPSALGSAEGAGG